MIHHDANGNRHSLAGRPYHGCAQDMQCVRIMTGAKMPGGTDTVIMQEQVECADNMIRVGAGHRPGQNVRQAGEDLAIGEVAVRAGEKLSPAELGCLPHWESLKSSLPQTAGGFFLDRGPNCAQSVSLWLKERSMTVTVIPYTACWRA